MDYRRLLGKTTTLVLPYLGMASVVAADRRLRVEPPDAEGWWCFEVRGRKARALEPAEPPDLTDRPTARGHFAEGWLFLPGGRAERVLLLPEAEPEPLAPMTARRWHDGSLLFEALDFEDDPEECARQALEARGHIDGVPGVVPSLRAAFGYSLLAASARDQNVPVHPNEAGRRLAAIAAGGMPAARRWLDELAEARRLEAYRLASWRRARPDRPRRPAPPSNVDERVEQALRNTDAELIRLRRLEDGQLEVHFSFMGDRFISVVEAATLQVIDAGICLSGADRECNLDSLPGVIREAIDTGELCITRH